MYETELTVVGTVITRVGRRHLPDGTAVAGFRVASNSRRFDRATDTWTDGDSLFVSVTCWRRLAENVHASFTVGDPIIVRGRLHSRSYDDKDGRRQSTTELHATAVGPDLARSTVTITRDRRTEDAASALAGRPADRLDDRSAPCSPAGNDGQDDRERGHGGARSTRARGQFEERTSAVEAGVGV